MTQIDELIKVLERPDAEMETVRDLRNHLIDPALRPQLRKSLRTVLLVGPKTRDYFDILCGIPTRVAIDLRIRKGTAAAGISNQSYDHLAAVIRRAADIRGWRPGDLDGTLRNL